MASHGSTIYDELGIPTVINAVGEHTRISGTRMRPEAADAMKRAVEAHAHLADLQAHASELIAEATGAEMGYVTSGAAAALTLATAACIAGSDYRITNQLPHTDDVPSDVLIARAHRNEYEVAFRAAGANLVSFGLNDLGNGVEDVEPWEIETAITDETVAVAFVDRPFTELPLEMVVEVAHDHGLPVIVDAAAELPPKENLTRYIDQGVDLVAFSGGKAIRGPQATGILAGRSELVSAAALQHLPSGVDAEFWAGGPPSKLFETADLPGLPRHGLGRGMKVGKEELLGLVTALRLFLDEDEDELHRKWNERAHRASACLEEVDGLDTQLCDGDDSRVATTTLVSLDERSVGTSATDLIRRLRKENPRIYVDESQHEQGLFRINPKCLTDEELDHVIERIEANLENPEPTASMDT